MIALLPALSWSAHHLQPTSIKHDAPTPFNAIEAFGERTRPLC
jgi:hypothetical protein